MINYAPFSRTKVRYKLIGKPPVPKTGVGLKTTKEDAVFAYCIERRIFNMFKVNDILYVCGLKIIPPK